MPQQLALSVYRGDSYHWQFTLFADAAKTQPYDLTGAEAKAEIRQATGTPVLATMTCTVTQPNIVDVDLAATDSQGLAIASAKWDLQLTWTADGRVKTVVAGAVTVEGDITDSVVVVSLATGQPRVSAFERRAATG